MQTSHHKVATQALRAAAKLLDHSQLNRQSQVTSYLARSLMKIQQRVLEETQQALQRWYPKHAYYLAQHFFDRPDFGKVESSHSGVSPSEQLGYHWCIHGLGSPINFVKAYPYYGLALSLAYRKEWVLSAVFDPVHNELFLVDKDFGAQLEGRRLRLSLSPMLEGNLCIGVVTAGVDANQALMCLLERCPSGLDLRLGGDSALSLMDLLAGRLDLLLVDRAVVADPIFKFWLSEAGGITAQMTISQERSTYYWAGSARKIDLAKRLLNQQSHRE